MAAGQPEQEAQHEKAATRPSVLDNLGANLSGAGGRPDGEVAGEQEGAIAAAPQGAEAHREQKLPSNVIRFARNDQKAAPQGAKQAKRPKTKRKSGDDHARRSPGSREAEWLHSLLPGASNGWWDVAENGKGFKFHFRWREAGKQRNLPFPRISAEQFKRLKEATNERAKFLIADRVYGHIEDLCAPGSARADRARAVAQRVGFAVGNNLDVGARDSGVRRA